MRRAKCSRYGTEDFRPHWAAADGAYARQPAALGSAREVAGQIGISIAEGTAGGRSDGNTTNLFAPTLDGFGAVGDGAHAAHEHVQIESLPERAALLAGLLALPSLREQPNTSASIHNSDGKAMNDPPPARPLLGSLTRIADFDEAPFDARGLGHAAIGRRLTTCSVK